MQTERPRKMLDATMQWKSKKCLTQVRVADAEKTSMFLRLRTAGRACLWKVLADLRRIINDWEEKIDKAEQLLTRARKLCKQACVRELSFCSTGKTSLRAKAENSSNRTEAENREL